LSTRCFPCYYSDIIRKSEKKPIRIFLQDGRNDNRGQRLTDKGYDVN